MDISELIKSNKLDKAKSILEKKIANEPYNPLTHYYLSRIYLQEENFQFALVELNKIISRNIIPKELNLLRIKKDIAFCYFKLSKFNEALEEYIRLEKEYPGNIEVLQKTGEVYFTLNMFPQAFTYFKKILELQANNVDALTYAGICCFYEMDYNSAESYLTQAISYSPKKSLAHYFLGLNYQVQKFYDRAIIEYEKSIADKNFKLLSYFRLGEVYQAKDMWTQAINFYENGIELYENSIIPQTVFTKNISELILQMRYNLAECYLIDHDFESAIEQWQEILAIKPDYKDVELKLKQNARYGRDRLQDFLVANEYEFEKICKYFIQSLGFDIERFNKLSNEEIDFIARSKLPEKKGTYLISIYRSNSPVTERIVLDFEKKLEKYKQEQGIIISPSGISPTGLLSVYNKPIEFVGKSQSLRLLKKYETRV